MPNTRRSLLKSLAALPAFVPAVRAQSASEFQIPKGPFEGIRASLAAYEIPKWFQDAKFGIWAHWGPQSAIEAGDWYARNMYMQGSPQYNYHVQTYGHPSKFGFKDTIPAWKAAAFDPESLIALYKKAGAKYFVSMGVHHDNFDLWNSRHQPWNSTQMGPRKDIVGLWRKAALAQDLRFGVSEHLWITYKWFSVSHGHDAAGPLTGVAYDGANSVFQNLYVNSDEVFTKLDWNESNIPEWWKRHWFLRIRDLVDQYEPDLLYTDGAVPFESLGLNLVAHHYNVSAKRHNGKTEAIYCSKRLEDSEQSICLLDRERGVVDKIWPTAWQTDTCLGDWHYKRGMRYKTPKTVIDLLVDIVSRNGNLLLNFPLPSSGRLDPEELDILSEITAWMAVNSEAIHGTRPWKIFGSGPGSAASAQAGDFNESKRKDLTADDVRFTTKGSTLYAFAMGRPVYKATFTDLALDTALRINKVQKVELLGRESPLEFTHDNRALTVTLPPDDSPVHALAFKLTGALA